MGRKFSNLDPDHPFNLPVDEATLLELSDFAHPFGVLLRTHMAKKNMKLRHVHEISTVDRTTISRMTKGERLEGTRARSRILAIINGLIDSEVLRYVDEANKLLDAANQHWLSTSESAEDVALLSRLKTRDLASNEAPITVVREEAQVYEGAREFLLNSDFTSIRIYAPVALWYLSPHKPVWFSAIVEYLRRNQDAEALMLFGVPYRRKNYNYMKDILRIFEVLEEIPPPGKKRPAIVIRYIPPQKYVDPAPTVGFILFDSEVLSIGFGLRETMEKIDTAWIIPNVEIAASAEEWFDSKIWPIYDDHELQRTQPRLLPMQEGFKRLESLYKDQFTEEWRSAKPGS